MAVELPLTSLTLLFVEKVDLLLSDTMRFVTLLATSLHWLGVKSSGAYGKKSQSSIWESDFGS